jgi:hypothetical protein
MRWSCDGLAMIMRLPATGGTPDRPKSVPMAATTEDYERRRAFVESMKTMGRPEFIEIARILRRGGVAISENRSGLFFDMAKVPDDVFDQLLEFHNFVIQNSKELDKRQAVMKSFASKPAGAGR